MAPKRSNAEKMRNYRERIKLIPEKYAEKKKADAKSKMGIN
jgi:hypothetical protein